MITSTGTAAGNAAGAMVEAQSAGTPVLHITGQIDSPWLDRNLGFLHEAKDQPGMLKAVSKSFWRIADAKEALDILKQAAHDAMTPPRGPVSIEIPIDVQADKVQLPEEIDLLPVTVDEVGDDQIDAVVNALCACKRPLLWAGGGCREAR